MEDKIMSDYKKALIKLINSEITGYQIYKKTGVSQSVISGLRNGKKEVDDLKIKTTEKLYSFYMEEIKQ